MKYKDNKIVYEVGDWVYFHGKEQPDLITGHWVVGKVFKITRLDNDLVYEQIGCNDLSNIRPATQEEIDKATEYKKIKVGKFDVIFRKECIAVGCEIIYKEKFLKIGKKAKWI